MTQSVDRLFGITLDIEPDIYEAEYAEFREQLVEHLQALSEIPLDNVEVYIHQLRISTKENHLGIAPLGARLSRLNVQIEPMKKKKANLIWFLNRPLRDRNLRLKPDEEVKIDARKYRISYSLSADYCQTHEDYSDYIVTVIMKGCQPKHRLLQLTATAYATERFKARLLNFRGYATTKLNFPLDSARQLPLTFENRPRNAEE